MPTTPEALETAVGFEERNYRGVVAGQATHEVDDLVVGKYPATLPRLRDG